MKTLVIHIGYPKTATSTIQDGFFKGLHEEKKVNYLGKYNRDGNGSICAVWNPWAPFVNHCVYDEPLSLSVLTDLSSFLRNGINVLSNEDFPVSFFNIEKRCYLRESDPFLVPERILFLTEKLGISNVKIVATLRNQCDAIYSSYVEGWRGHFRFEPSLDSFEKYLSQGLKKGINGIFRMFFYHEVLSEYIRVFGKENVHVTLFEELKHDLPSFCSRFLAPIAPDMTDLLEEVLASNVRNRKRKTASGEYLTDDVTLYEELLSLYKRMIPPPLHELLRKSLVPRMGRRIFGGLKGKSGIVVERPSDEDVKEIKAVFLESNERLAMQFGMKDKMKNYGYIP